MTPSDLFAELRAANRKLQYLQRQALALQGDAARAELRKRRPQTRAASVRIERIIEAVAAEWRIDPVSITKGKCRMQKFRDARHAACYLAGLLTNASLPTIGAALAGLHHTTVLHAQRRIAGRMQVEPELAVKLAAVQERLSK